MDEGVDPTQMCQSLVNKVARSKQLTSVADPDVLALFEDWLDELEEEIRIRVAQAPGKNPEKVAEELGLSKTGALFFAAKLKQKQTTGGLAP